MGHIVTSILLSIKINTYNIKVKTAISPQTDLLAIKPYLSKINLILVMTVNPGFSSQVFQHHIFIT